jgi:hypothetical protein
MRVSAINIVLINRYTAMSPEEIIKTLSLEEMTAQKSVKDLSDADFEKVIEHIKGLWRPEQHESLDEAFGRLIAFSSEERQKNVLTSVTNIKLPLWYALIYALRNLSTKIETVINSLSPEDFAGISLESDPASYKYVRGLLLKNLLIHNKTHRPAILGWLNGDDLAKKVAAAEALGDALGDYLSERASITAGVTADHLDALATLANSDIPKERGAGVRSLVGLVAYNKDSRSTILDGLNGNDSNKKVAAA